MSLVSHAKTRIEEFNIKINELSNLENVYISEDKKLAEKKISNFNEQLLVQEEQLLVQEDQLLVQEKQEKLQEDQLLVQEKQEKLQEEQQKLQEEQQKLQEEQQKLQENQQKLREEQQKLREEQQKLQENQQKLQEKINILLKDENETRDKIKINLEKIESIQKDKNIIILDKKIFDNQLKSLFNLNRDDELYTSLKDNYGEETDKLIVKTEIDSENLENSRKITILKRKRDDEYDYKYPKIIKDNKKEFHNNLCNSMCYKQYCQTLNCRYAHSIEECHPVDCHYQRNCKNLPFCIYIHYFESKTEWYERRKKNNPKDFC